MITSEKLEIYKRFNGDSDSWARVASNHNDMVMNSSDWSLIEKLIQETSLVKKGLVVESYILHIEEKLKQSCDNEETIRTLKEMV